ncbi:MAG: type II secretion system ATPase GspE [Desulfatiglans sp.]|nr:type II secretion system ATPase GspE [Desulfatiglans sp.]
MKSLGQILLELNLITQGQLDEGMRIQEEKGGLIGEILVRKKYLSEPGLLKALGIQYNMDYHTAISVNELNTEFTEKVPIQYLKKYCMIPLIGRDSKKIAINNPVDFQPLDDLRLQLGLKDAEIVLAPKSEIISSINFIYDSSQDSAEQVLQDMHDESGGSMISAIQEAGDLLDDTSDAPIIKLVNVMLSQAVKDKASDIHIEPTQKGLKIRYRLDGILYDMISPQKQIQAALISRIKVMADMNIAEKRLPQDGRIEIRIGDKNIDIRVSTIPTAYGERVVLRLLDKTKIFISVTELGMPNERLGEFNELINAAHGIFLVTGPTGSGKTTTLYAALSQINNTDKNIITIEDPIEYQLEGVGQIQVNPKIDLTFARGLRSIVRQDPDVILVGEIRDLETAEIAIQSALTGHLVFSTLHTNDAASAVTRLIDMGIEPFLITSSVIAILAQRLVRVICPACKEAYNPDEQSLSKVGITPQMLEGRNIYRGRGCPACLNTGYSGRTGIFELLIVNESIQNLILKTSDSNAITQKAVENGMVTLRQNGAQKVLNGITTIEEVFRVTYQ